MCFTAISVNLVKGKMHLGKEIMHAAQQKDRYFVTLSHLLTRTY